MKDLMKLSPELEGNIASFERGFFDVKNETDRNDVIAIIREVKTTKQKVIAFFKPQKDALNKAKEELMKIINQTS